MRSTFFIPRGETCPWKEGMRTAGGLIVLVKFLGNVVTASHIGYTFEVRPLGFKERLAQVSDRLTQGLANRLSVAA